MVIKLDLSSLRRIQWHEYLTRFFVGGTVTVIAGLIAKEYGPITGGIFLAMPAIFPAGATLLEKHEREKKRRAGIAFTLRGRLAAALDARGATMGAIAMIAFGGMIWGLLPRANAVLVFVLALVAWFVLASLLWYLRKHHPWSPPKIHRSSID